MKIGLWRVVDASSRKRIARSSFSKTDSRELAGMVAYRGNVVSGEQTMKMAESVALLIRGLE